MKLPETLHFLRPGWWALHVAAVGAVFGAGFLTGQHLAGDSADHHGAEAAHAAHGAEAAHAAHGAEAAHAAHGAEAAHEAHHDHSSPEALRPLMRQMLADAVQLQGALADDDLTRAAAHAEAIAGACEDDGATHEGSLPERLGPAFVRHDRALHDSASQLGEALRAGRREDALSLGREMVASCRSCHAQAPAASEVDLRVLQSFADSLTDVGEGTR